MSIKNIFNKKFPGRLLPVLWTVTALCLMIDAPLTAFAQCVCDDGYCESVGREYFEFGEVIDENCHFTADVKRPEGVFSSGFIVNASGITIDGRGYCLDGVSPDQSLVGANGIYANSDYLGWQAQAVTIRNLEIKNFWQGIKLAGNTSNPMTGCVVDNCVIHDNGVSGRDEKFEGIWLQSSEGCTVQNCTIYNNNQGSGIAIGESDSNRFIDNEIYGNYKHGTKAWGSSWYLYASHNYVHDNGLGGINHKCGSSYSTIEYNTCSNNAGPGVLAQGTGNTVRGNISTDNVNSIDPEFVVEDGIGISCSPNDLDAVAYVEDNIACGNEYYDIYMGDDVDGFGAYNTCNTTYNFNDSGHDGCTYVCDDGFPVAKFYAEDTMVCAGSVQFHDQSLCAQGSILSWDWDFGDGAHSYIEDPAHTYASGVYTVTLTVTMTGGQSGTDSMTKENYITVCPYPGDLDEDSDVDGTDYYYFYTNCIAGSQGWCDINGDGSVDGNDMAALGLMDCVSCQ